MHEGGTLANSASERRRLERTDTDVNIPDTRRPEKTDVETKIEAVDEPDETKGKETVEGKLEHVLKDLERSEQAEVSENAISSRLSEAFSELEAEEKREQRPLEKQLEDAFKEIAIEEALEKREPASGTLAPEIEPAKAELHEAEVDSQEVKEKQQEYKKPTHFEWQEENRIRHESSVHSEALEHRIDPERVGDALSEIRKTGELSPKELTDAVEKLYSTVENPQLGSVHYAELYNTKENLETDWRRGLAKEIRANREEIERTLNERLGLAEDPGREVRVAVTDDKMYYWYKDTGPDKWLNVLEAEKIYLRSKEDKMELIDEAQHHLHIRGGNEVAQRNLSDVMNQLSHLEKIPANRVCRYRKPPYLDGETLHFIGDTTGQSLEEMKPRLSHIGKRKGGRVYNLQFPDIHVYRTVFVAVMGSDGHHALEGWVTYYEKDPERRELAIDEFQRFGDIDIRMNPKRPIDVPLPKVLSPMARHWGIPRGDKAIHNKGLVESVIKEPLEVKVTYLPPVIAEDGCFSGGRFTITRANVLHAGKKAEKYREMFGIEPLVTQEHIDLVCKHGKVLGTDLCYRDGDRVRLTVGELQDLSESKDLIDSERAGKLISIINENPNRLLSDEVNHIIRPLGIKIRHKPDHLVYYKQTERLSLKSRAATESVNDTIRWALIAPPNHPRKMAKVVKFIDKKPEKVKRIKEQILRDGLSVARVWEE
jgi:hypothetical protein